MKNNILVFDIETAPMAVYVWDLREQYISPDKIRKDWCVIAWSAKWLGDPASSIMYRDNRGSKNLQNDKELITPLWKLLDEADSVVTQNGKNFDCPKLNARFIFHGMNPPSPYTHLDTYQIIKHSAGFSSNKLEYLSEKLCAKHKKLKHGKFPGFSLWTECMAGNVKAWDEMKKYNINDVLATEELYLKIRAWAPKNAPVLYTTGSDSMQCGTCGHQPLVRRGYARGINVIRPRYQCTSCGHWTSGKAVNKG